MNKFVNAFIYFRLKRNLTRIRCIGLKRTLFAIKNGKHISRYGDGELAWAAGIPYPQPCGVFTPDISHNLSRRLFEKAGPFHMQCVNSNMLLQFPFGSPHGTKRFYKDFLLANHESFSSLFKRLEGRQYGEACFPYVYREKRIRNRRKLASFFKDFMGCLEGKDVLIVEGESGHMGINNDFLSSSLSISRILCPDNNAFDRVEEIKGAVFKILDRFSLVLLALGPAATLIVHDFSSIQNVPQMIDIGSLEKDYVLFMENAGLPFDQSRVLGIADYQNQILRRII